MFTRSKAKSDEIQDEKNSQIPSKQATYQSTIVYHIQKGLKKINSGNTLKINKDGSFGKQPSPGTSKRKKNLYDGATSFAMGLFNDTFYIYPDVLDLNSVLPSMKRIFERSPKLETAYLIYHRIRHLFEIPFEDFFTTFTIEKEN